MGDLHADEAFTSENWIVSSPVKGYIDYTCMLTWVNYRSASTKLRKKTYSDGTSKAPMRSRRARRGREPSLPREEKLSCRCSLFSSVLYRLFYRAILKRIAPPSLNMCSVLVCNQPVFLHATIPTAVMLGDFIVPCPVRRCPPCRYVSVFHVS